MEARLHVMRFNLVTVADADGPNTVLMNGVLELDGQFITNGEVQIKTAGGEMLVVNADLIVDSLEIVEHSSDTWGQITKALD